MSSPHIPCRSARLSLLGLCLLLGACGARAEPVFVAPTDATVTSRLEVADEGRGQYIVVHNRSTVEITVTSVTLSQCENVRNQCQTTRLRVQVPPGRERRVAMVRVRSFDRPHGFRYAWTWEGSTSLADVRVNP